MPRVGDIKFRILYNGNAENQVAKALRKGEELDLLRRRTAKLARTDDVFLGNALNQLVDRSPLAADYMVQKNPVLLYKSGFSIREEYGVWGNGRKGAAVYQTMKYTGLDLASKHYDAAMHLAARYFAKKEIDPEQLEVHEVYGLISSVTNNSEVAGRVAEAAPISLIKVLKNASSDRTLSSFDWATTPLSLFLEKQPEAARTLASKFPDELARGSNNRVLCLIAFENIEFAKRLFGNQPGLMHDLSWRHKDRFFDFVISNEAVLDLVIGKAIMSLWNFSYLEIGNLVSKHKRVAELFVSNPSLFGKLELPYNDRNPSKRLAKSFEIIKAIVRNYPDLARRIIDNHGRFPDYYRQKAVIEAILSSEMLASHAVNHAPKAFREAVEYGNIWLYKKGHESLLINLVRRYPGVALEIARKDIGIILKAEDKWHSRVLEEALHNEEFASFIVTNHPKIFIKNPDLLEDAINEHTSLASIIKATKPELMEITTKSGVRIGYVVDEITGAFQVLERI